MINALERLGISEESIHKVRLGQGVVGKTSCVCIAACVVVTAAVFSNIHPWVSSFAIVAVVIGCFFSNYRAFKYAEKFPAEALMEGATLLAWKKAELGALNQPVSDTDSSLPIANPQPDEVAMLVPEAENG